MSPVIGRPGRDREPAVSPYGDAHPAVGLTSPRSCGSRVR
jgi:hypothetical protein